VVLVLLPASNTQTAVRRGKPFEATGLSFPSLAPTRAAVLAALVEVSAAPDATRRLCVRASLDDVVRRRSGGAGRQLVAEPRLQNDSG
jgi:uncharacterized protein